MDDGPWNFKLMDDWLSILAMYEAKKQQNLQQNLYILASNSAIGF